MSPEISRNSFELTPFKGRSLENTKLFLDFNKNDEIMMRLLSKFFNDNLHLDFLEEIPKFPVKLFFNALNGELRETYNQDELREFSKRISKISKDLGKPLLIPSLNGILFENLACAQFRVQIEREKLKANVLSPKETKAAFLSTYSEAARKRPLFYNSQQGYAQEIYQYEYQINSVWKPLYIPDGIIKFDDGGSVIILEYKKDLNELKESQFTNIKLLKTILKSSDGEYLRSSLSKNIGVNESSLKYVHSGFGIDLTIDNPEREEFIRKETDSELIIGVCAYKDEVAYLRSSMLIDYLHTVNKSKK